VNVPVSMPAESVEAIARRAAEIVLEELGDRRGEGPELLTVLEAAAVLRCNRQRVYDLISSGRLAKVKDGSRTLIRRVDLDAYLRLPSALSPAERRRSLRSA